MSDRERTLRFLSALGHELRNPLAALTSGFNLLDRSQSPDKTAGLLSMMRDKLRLLGELVDECFDVAKLSLTSDRGVETNVFIEEVLQRAVERASVKIGRSGAANLSPQISVECLSGRKISTNPELLARLFAESLLFVSGHHTGAAEGTDRVQLSAESNGNNCRITIRREGPLSYSSESGRESSPQASSGSIRPKDSAVVVQSLQSLRAELVTTLASILSIESLILQDGVQFDLGTTFDSSSHSITPSDSPDQSAKRVLVVEDSEDSALLLSSLLRESGYKVEVAPDGASALKLTDEWRPQVILLDVGLPDMDGLAVAKEIRRITEDSLRPIIIAVTGYGESDASSELLSAGLDHYLTKPIDFDRLEEVLRSFNLTKLAGDGRHSSKPAAGASASNTSVPRP